MLRFSTSQLSSDQVEGEDIETMKIVESDPLEESDYASNIIVSEVPVEAFLEENIIEDTTVRETWLEAPTKMLISMLIKMKPYLGKSFDLKNKHKMVQKIQKALAEQGYNFTAKQVLVKCYTMERKYKQLKTKQTKTGRRRKPFPLEKEMDKLFGKEQVSPEYILDSEEYGSPTGTVVCTPFPKKARARCGADSNHTRILQKLDEMAKEKTKFHEEMLKRLEKKEKMENERNQLLKRIATTLETNFNSIIQTSSSSEEI